MRAWVLLCSRLVIEHKRSNMSRLRRSKRKAPQMVWPSGGHMMVREPVSRILYSVPLAETLTDDHSSWPNITVWLQRPTRRFNAPSRHVFRQAGTPFLFGLAPCGVYPALTITDQAVRSYRTFSPLPDIRPGDSKSLGRLNAARRYLLCGTGRSRNAGPGRYPAHCSVEFGLSSHPLRTGDRPVR